MADYYLAALVAVISTAIPGTLLMLPFAKRAGMQLPFAIGFGLAAGIVLVPLLGFLESLIGLPFSSTLAFLNIAALSIIGAFLCIREKAFADIKPAGDAKSFLFANWHWLALLLIMLLAFWMDSMSSQPYTYEVDPYFYLRATQFIVQDGSIPAKDNLAWYPNLYTHRERPLTHYLTAGWHFIANAGAQFDKEALYVSASPYPPLFAALAAFMIFAVVFQIWGGHWGLAAAALFVFSPVTLMKFAAGVVEQQPWGIFALLFFAAAYCLCLKKGGRLYALLASLALLGAVLGSKQGIFAIYLFAAFLPLQSLRDFLSGKMREEFLVESAIIWAGGLLGLLLMVPYRFPGMPEGGALLAAAAFAALLFGIAKFEKATARRPRYLLALAAIAFLALLLTPLGPWLARNVSEDILGEGTSLFSSITVEEQVVTSGMDVQLGPIGGSGLPILILAASATMLSLAVISRESKLRLLVLVLLPLALLGYAQGKFFLHSATLLPIALAALLGEAEAYARPTAKKEEGAALSFSIDMGSGQAEAKPEEKKPYASYAPLLVLAIGVLAVAAQAFPVISDVSAGFSGSYAADEGGWNCTKLALDGKPLAYHQLCAKIPPDWTAALGWVEENGGNSSVLVWWDYGHWVNYLGQSPTQIRGDLTYPKMISDVSVLYTSGTPQGLGEYMRQNKIRYVAFDSGLIPKWDSLSYLSCKGRNMTVGPFDPAKTGPCEQELAFEYLFVPLQGRSASDICEINGSVGLFAPSSFNRTYCLIEPEAGIGENGTMLAFSENGTLLHMGQAYVAQVLVNGRLSAELLATYNESSWEYRQGRAYDSLFYSGLVLRNITGLRQVYPEGGQPGSIIIFELENPT